MVDGGVEGVQGKGRVVGGGGGGRRVEAVEGGGWRGVEGGHANWVEDQGMEGGRVEMKGGGCIVGGGYRGMEGGEWRG